MRVKQLDISGFKSFAKKTELFFDAPISAVVGPNGSGKSNVVEAIRFVLGEQSLKSMRGKRGEDLIWNGSRITPRQNRARVSIVFENADRVFPLDYEEVTITREVHRDGVGEYYINNSPARLRDVVELLSSVHIGASGHHIISQGEADRVLTASIKERRAMIEDALGLKIYQWKISESDRKLGKTNENMAQVESLRREIAPHVKFLKKQVEKIEAAHNLRDELAARYREYLKREEVYLTRERDSVAREREAPDRELEVLEKKFLDAKTQIDGRGQDDANDAQAIRDAEVRVSRLRAHKDELSRLLGRVEGGIEYEEDRAKEEAHREDERESVVAVHVVREVIEHVDTTLRGVDGTQDVHALSQTLRAARRLLSDFVARITKRPDEEGVRAEEHNSTERLKKLYADREEITERLKKADEEEHHAVRAYDMVRKKQEEIKIQAHEAERSLYEIRARKSELLALLERMRARKDRVDEDTRRFEEEVREGVALIGTMLREYSTFVVPEDAEREPRAEQEDRRRKIEKIKIRLEDMGGGGGEEVVKEYQDAVTRDQFLEHELIDLKQSAESLRVLIDELTQRLDKDFCEGIEKINTQFNEFFSLMFGGGSATLTVIAPKKKMYSEARVVDDAEGEAISEPEDEEAGIEINVVHPHKKIRGLEVLSGGERALTSIALLFAISQVNPPPFLVLDETDAALDEANSRKYGDMLENLAKYSQLIVVTHNRETMSRASILYGVTMGSDAVSKLLSIKFDEALAVAK
ncbi:MAG: AAA family ATPase [Minisyncoccota bacterium]